MNNTRFATVIHIVTLLADNTAEWLTSDFIASSININPVMVRKELGVLADAGLVVTHKGKEGGGKLGKSSSDIYLSDVYLAVKNSEILGKQNLHTNPQCTIGKQINAQLDILFADTEALVLSFLKKKKLSDFVALFH